MTAFNKTPAASATSKKNIFISYREKDTAGETGRLVDALKQYFDDSQIFMDIEKIEPGADFTEVIAQSLEQCNVMLAVIGPNWLGFDAVKNTSRIKEATDWVRLELATALKRNIRIIPVLVDGGALPAADQLPPDVEPLLKKQAYEISNNRWKYDTEQLIQFLRKNMGIPTKEELQAGSTAKQQPFLKYAVLLLVLVGIGVFAMVQLSKKPAGKAIENTETASKESGNKVQQDTAALPTEMTNTKAGAGVHKKGTNNSKDISGKWIEVDEGQKSTFVFTQNKNKLNVQVFAMGQQLGTGTGDVENRVVHFKFDLLGSGTTVKATVSPDGQSMKGTFTMDLTNDPQPFALKRL